MLTVVDKFEDRLLSSCAKVVRSDAFRSPISRVQFTTIIKKDGGMLIVKTVLRNLR